MEQAETEVVPSSSLVEIEVEVGAWVKMKFSSFFGWVGGWAGGEWDKSDIKLISTQVLVEVDV